MKDTSEDRGRRAIALILRYGSQISTLIMLLGLCLLLLRGPVTSLSGGQRLKLETVFRGLIRLEPVALTEFGILLLLLTPIFRILAAVVSFTLEREYKYVWISLGVLSVVILSIRLAVG